MEAAVVVHCPLRFLFFVPCLWRCLCVLWVVLVCPLPAFVRSLGRPPPSFVRGWFGLVRSGFWFGLVLARFGFVPFRSVPFRSVPSVFFSFVMIDVVPVFFGSGVAAAACCDLIKLPSFGCWGGFSV